MGAMALFGEKYGDIVRVVQIGDYSLELCGGCHVGNSAEIGMFRIISESGIGAGTRRIEAVTGKGAYEEMNGQIKLLQETATLLKANTKDIPQRVESLYAELKELQKENESLLAKIGNAEAGAILTKVKEMAGGVKLLAEQVNAKDMGHLRTMADELKNKLGSGVIILGAVNGEKVNLIAAVTKDLTGKGLHAGNLVKQAAEICGGGGGGRPDLAQAGGKKPEKLAEALTSAEEWVKSVL
jgi:alanyl-tRNA synthetase